MRKLIQAWSSGVTFCLAGLIGEAAAGGQGLRVLRAEHPLPYGQQRRELVAGSAGSWPNWSNSGRSARGGHPYHADGQRRFGPRLAASHFG
jgi:hypothetical protein